MSQQQELEEIHSSDKLKKRMTYKLHPTYMVIRTHTINQSDDPDQPLIPKWSVPFEYRTPDMKTVHLASRNCFFDRRHALDSQEGQSALERHIQVEEERNQTLFQNPYLLFRVPGTDRVLFITCIVLLLLQFGLACGLMVFDLSGLLFPEGYEFRMFGISSRKLLDYGNVALNASGSTAARVVYFIMNFAVTFLGVLCFIIVMLSNKKLQQQSNSNNTTNDTSRQRFLIKYRDWILRLFAFYIVSLTLCILVTALFFLSSGLHSFVVLAVQYIAWSCSHKAKERSMITYYTTSSF
ncbi:hypothetical protein C9374_013424 [Naegleria lovaniensis]|uniref:Uncharacterized protein n=1 Tax=Naegleria lovaniensis TaxID=51637 RepID=A0AA88H1C1_NAELO|nr:uncharacterized protein C9374_013424 [Naegleria lovaniensis]KAG2391939.1 hypothetical protein C9374_013424 [Naegleria lovaniensis]